MSRVSVRHLLTLITFCLAFLYHRESYSRSNVQPVINPQSYEKIIGYLLVSDRDVTIYKKMFRALEQADFEELDKLQKKLENHILLGAVLAEKYLHPKYKSSAAELSDWLENYNSYPQAKRIYQLASRKASDPEKLKKPVFLDNGTQAADENSVFVNRQRGRFRDYINRGKPVRRAPFLKTNVFAIPRPMRCGMIWLQRWR